MELADSFSEPGESSLTQTRTSLNLRKGYISGWALPGVPFHTHTLPRTDLAVFSVILYPLCVGVL